MIEKYLLTTLKLEKIFESSNLENSLKLLLFNNDSCKDYINSGEDLKDG